MLSNSTKELLKKHNIRPNKRLGQNFLIDEMALQNIVNAAALNKNDVVVEVGAGLGVITTELARQAKRVIAVEKDKALIPILRDATKNFKNVEIIHDDILKIDWKLIGNWKLVGNIPYYITAPLIRKFLEADSPPKSMTLMVQKEMARRITAAPPNMSILAVSVQVYATPEIVSFVPRSSFWPQSDVDSAIIRIKNIESPKENKLPTGQARIKNRKLFFRIVRAGFSSPRKQLFNNLSRGLKVSRNEAREWLAASGIDYSRRAETLSVGEWINLTKIK